METRKTLKRASESSVFVLSCTKHPVTKVSALFVTMIFLARCTETIETAKYSVLNVEFRYKSVYDAPFIDSNSQASHCYKKLLACAAECEFVASQETKM